MQSTPWYHWPISLLALIWHLGGAVGYCLTQLGVQAYLDQLPGDQLAYFRALPLWVDAAWGIAVWVGLLGAWLLVVRHGASVLLLALSFAALLAASAWLIALSDPRLGEVTGPAGVWVMVGATVAALLFYLYARAMRQAGVLG